MREMAATSPASAPGRRWIRAGTDVWRGIALTGLAIWEALLALWAAFCTLLVVLGVGVYLLPSALDGTRNEAELQRQLAGRWSGVPVASHYLRDEQRITSFAGALRLARSRLSDGATWRDLLWLVVNPLVGPFMAFLPALAIIHGIWGVVLLALWEPVVRSWDNSWYLFVPLRNQGTAILSAGLGVLEIVLGFLIAGAMLRLHGRWVHFVLGRASTAALTSRVEQLAASRSDTVDMQASELRRIERDLHDGAQSRLIAMGMTITAAERLLDDDPAAARILLAEARDSSTQALKELRELVRGIHPPVLADRGLVDAIRARALESPLPVAVHSTFSGRLALPVESAAYFAVSELLTNVAKHAHAQKCTVTIDHGQGDLRITVEDDGSGGARAEQGSGLAGVGRRLAAFDGRLDVDSPAGGPTRMRIAIPSDPVDPPSASPA